MQNLTKGILTMRIMKATKVSDIFDYKLRALRSFEVKLAFPLLVVAPPR
jgi:hypothetical protein